MERNFDLDQFLEDIAKEQLLESISPKHLEKENTRLQQLLEHSSSYSPEFEDIKPGKFERLNPILPEQIEEPASRAMKKPVDEKGYPFVSQSDAACILEIDRKAAIISGTGVIKVEKEISSSTKSSRIWIRLIDLKKYLETRDPIKAAKIGKCLMDIDEFRASASQNGFKLRFLGSDYDRPEFYRDLVR
jgi:hypothetical protein